MKVAEAAKVLGVGEQRVRNLIYGGRLKSEKNEHGHHDICLLYTSPSPRDRTRSRMPSSA